MQRAQFGRLLSGTPDALPGWRIRHVEITDPDVLAKSGLKLHPILVPGAPGDSAGGTVFDISDEELAAADAYEVSDYKRVEARLASGLKAFVYVKA